MVAGGVIALGLLALGMYRVTAERQAAIAQTEQEEVLPERVEVVALGRLEPDGEVIQVSGPTGDRISRLEIAEGDEVAEGTILAYLESYEERLADRNLAASQLAEAEALYAAQTNVQLSQIQEAQTRVMQVAVPSEFEIAGQEARIRELEASLSLAQNDLERSRNLYNEGAISQQEYDQQATQVREVQEQLNNAQANLVRLQAARSTDMQNAQAQVESAQATLSLSQVQAQVDSARSKLELAEAQLERTIIRAPSQGRILRVITQAGEAIADGGILELGDTGQMYVVAEVYESDIGRVQLGQSATITSRNGAFSESLTGTVTEIGWQIFKNDVLDDDPAANADARVVEVKIRLDQSEAVQGLTNLQVDVRIEV
jgi:HlyD family secretion protein